MFKRAIRILRCKPAAAVAAFVALSMTAPVAAQTTKPYDGYLCCSLYMEDDWIIDLSFNAPGRKLVPAGTPARLVAFSGWSIVLEIGGRRVGLFNDYSRALDMEQFAARYVVRTDPKPALQALPEKQREAILAGKVARGMTREQVIMAIRYPSTDYTPDMSKPLWHYWSGGHLEYQIFWNADWRVEQLFGSAQARAPVSADQ